MGEHGLAKELWRQLKAIAESKGFARVTRVDMTVGMLHGVTAEVLEQSFEETFQGTNFAGAAMDLSIVEPGEQFAPPGAPEAITANGWELLITRIEGEE